MNFTGERYIRDSNGLEIHLEHIQRYESILPLTEGKVILDAACGSGYGSFMISQRATMVYGIDINEEAIAFSKHKYKSRNIEYIVGSIDSLPFEDSLFDVIVSFETIEHVNVEMQFKFLEEIKRVLKPDGILIISTPNKHVYSDLPAYRNEYHLKEFYIEEFKNFISKYFNEYEIYHQNFHLSSVITRKNSDAINVLNDKPINDGRYVIFVCSDSKDNLEIKIDTIKLDIQNYYYENNPIVYKFVQSVDKQYGKLYIDYGEGLSELNTIISSYELVNKQFFITFKFDEDNRIVKGLRWDPIEGKYCRVDIKSIVCTYDDESFIELEISGLNSNGDNIDNSYEFTNFDPMIHLEGDFKGIRKLIISGELLFLEENQLISSIISKQECLMNDQLELRREKEVNEERIDFLYRKIDEHEKNIREIEHIISEKEERIKGLIEQNNELKTNLAQKNEAIIILEALQERKDREIIQNIEVIDDLKEEIYKITNSKSWRLTSPLRKGRSLLKRKNKDN